MGADINAIAEACSVSKTTVSKVFTQKGGVSETMRRKILETARRLNYTPKQVVAQDAIAIIVSKYAFVEGNSFRAMLLASVMNKLTDSGYLLKIVTSEELRYLVQSYTRLAILMPSGEEEDKMIAKLREMHLPVVAVNGVFDGCRSVCSDHAQSLELAVDHLVRNGHSRIALMLDFTRNWGARERLKGYESAMRRHGLEPLPWHSCDNGSITAVECLHQVIAEGATGLIIEGESIIDESVYMLNVLGIKVPQDLSVVTSEISRRSRWFMPPHTTTSQDMEAMAQQIAAAVRDTLDGVPPENPVTMLPARLIERSSVRKLNP